ncbi:MAG: hypothetical protein IJZ39_08250 [Oscillospiraceae bacterium]|nr:hypothetical protein [Oscillospiraceae bacterium]
MLTFRFTGASGKMVTAETLTSGMVGKEVKLEFSQEWDHFAKTAVFMAGSVTRDVVCVSDVVTIPAEVLAVPMERLYVGVYGVCAEGKATPTIRAQGPMIRPGVDPSGDAATDSDLPVWAQLRQEVDSLKKEHSDDASRIGGYYTPSVTQPTKETIRFAFSPSIDTMPVVNAITIGLPSGTSENADWDQNDASQPGYVNNRTHWVDDNQTVHPLDEKFIPDTIARKAEVLPMPQAADAGQFIKVSAVDENGTVTATEAVTVQHAEEVSF